MIIDILPFIFGTGIGIFIGGIIVKILMTAIRNNEKRLATVTNRDIQLAKLKAATDRVIALESASATLDKLERKVQTIMQEIKEKS